MKNRVTRRKFSENDCRRHRRCNGRHGRHPGHGPDARHRPDRRRCIGCAGTTSCRPATAASARKLMPEAEKALGIKVNFERVNGNDLQPRITSGIQSGAGPDIIMLFNNHPHLYQASLADMSDVAEEIGKEQGGYYALSEGQQPNRQAVDRHALQRSSAANAYRKSWFAEVGRHTRSRRPGTSIGTSARSSRPRAGPLGQSLGQSFGDPADVRLSLPVVRSAAPRSTTRARSSSTPRRSVEAVKYMVGDLEGFHGRGRSRLGRLLQQPRVPRRHDLLDLEWRLDLHLWRCDKPDKYMTDKKASR